MDTLPKLDKQGMKSSESEASATATYTGAVSIPQAELCPQTAGNNGWLAPADDANAFSQWLLKATALSDAGRREIAERNRETVENAQTGIEISVL